jgi:hypothetical protein
VSGKPNLALAGITILQGGRFQSMPEAAKRLGLNPQVLHKYHNNENSNKRALSNAAITPVESSVFKYILSQAVQGVDTAAKGAKQPEVKSFSDPLYYRGDDAGINSLHALGSHEDGTSWTVNLQRGNKTFILRRGLRGRKLFTKGQLKDRCFEWYIVKDETGVYPGSAKFVLHELIRNGLGGMDRKGKWMGYSAQQVWDEMFRDPQGGNSAAGTSAQEGCPQDS